MPKCIRLTKYFRSSNRFGSDQHSLLIHNGMIKRRRNGYSLKRGGGGRPARNPGRPPTLPPYPRGRVCHDKTCSPMTMLRGYDSLG